jgi:hypothetical protein
MTATHRILAMAILGFTTSVALAQVPAGVPYDPSKHPNPIVTWVNAKDFKKVSFAEASEQVGVELMSLSRDKGDRESVEVATPAPARQKVRIVGREFEATFYPVMRQNYKLKSGSSFALYTFRFPRALTTADFLNDVAFARPPRGTVPRFGSLPVPDRIEIRGSPGLYFDDGKQRTIYWFELGAGYSVTTDASKDELFRVLEDLL